MAISTLDYSYQYPGLLPLRPIEVQPVVEAAPLLQLIPIITGVPLSGIRLNKVLRPSKMVIEDNGCSDTYASSDITWTDVQIVPKRMKIQLSECFDVYNESLLELFLNQGSRVSDLTNTEIWSRIVDLVTTQIGRDVASMISFGNTADADAKWNVIDGMWKKILSDAYCSDSVGAISGSMSATQAMELLTRLYDNSPLELQARPASEKVMLVTPNIFRRYRQYLQQTGNTQAQNFLQPYDLLTGGAPETLQFNGITVAKIDQWEQDLADSTCPYFGVYNALALYTTVQNHRLATDTLNGFGNVEGWYEKKEDANYLRWRGAVGYNFIHCELNAYSVGNIS